jgi:hypothetical protein
MQQHTAQHLFSGIAFDVLGLSTVGWGLHEDKTYVELQLMKNETAAAAPNDAVCFQTGFEPVRLSDLQNVEACVNRVIR